MSPRLRWLIVWLFACLPLAGWWTSGLFDLDEGFYGAVVAEMNRRGEWITPYYNGHPWFEKPILLYWLAKPCVLLFGPQVGDRLPSVLATIGLLGTVAWFCRRRFSDDVAQMAVLILGGSLLIAIVGRMMMTDMLLVLFLTLALCAFWESLVGNARWRVLTGFALGGAVLAKGPVALILFGVVMGYAFWRYRELRPRFRGAWIPAWAALLIVIASWYVPAYLASGSLFVQKFLVEQNLERFTGGDAAHTLGGIASFFLYIPVLLVGMLPWSLWIIPACRRPKDQESTPADPGAFLVVWGVIVFLFFSVSGAKLPHYILPAFPPFAVLVAARIATPRFRTFAMAWCVVVAGVVILGFNYYYRASGQAELHRWARFVSQNAGRDSVAMYKMGRLEGDRGTGSLRIRETSKPSVVMLLDRVVTDTDDFDAILKDEPPVWILTRPGRIQPQDFAHAIANHERLIQIHAAIPEESYVLYRLLPSPDRRP